MVESRMANVTEVEVMTKDVITKYIAAEKGTLTIEPNNAPVLKCTPLAASFAIELVVVRLLASVAFLPGPIWMIECQFSYQSIVTVS